MRFFLCFTLMMLASTFFVGLAHGQQPPVTEIYKLHDANSDGTLDAKEVAGAARRAMCKLAHCVYRDAALAPNMGSLFLR